MSVNCGWASIGSNGKITGDMSGDQSGREVKTGNYYQFGQDTVYRFYDEDLAIRYAEKIEQACNNNNIGYDQNQRTTLFTQAEKHHFDITKINTPCECDCSSLVACCLNAIGILVNKNMTTRTLDRELMSTEYFMKITEDKYIDTDKYLRIGDIVNRAGKHVITVLEDGEKVEKPLFVEIGVEYYQRYTGSSTSIVDCFKDCNIDSSYSSRKSIADVNGINGYSGSTIDNLKMIILLKNGTLKTGQVDTDVTLIPITSNYYPRYTGSSSSIVDALKEMNILYTFSNRKKIAIINGIGNYTGTTMDNLKLLTLLKGGELKRV